MSALLLYALEGAVRGVRWDQLPPDVRKSLRHAAETPAHLAASLDASTPRLTTTRRRS